MYRNKIAIIFIFYNPTKKNVFFVEKVASKYNTIIVDNTPIERSNPNFANTDYISLNSNKGIAYAQNIGIKRAKEKGFKYIVFFDQDSEFEESYPQQIFEEYIRIQKHDVNLGLVGPLIINKETKMEYKSFNGEDTTIPFCKRTSLIISSGSIIATDIICKIGMMESRLFIDLVDYEVCWRLKNKGYNCYITDKVSINHQVGNKEIKILGLSFIISTPWRYYYQIRNTIWMWKRNYVPVLWKIKSFIRIILFSLFAPFYTSQYKDIYKYSLKGFKDGIIKR